MTNYVLRLWLGAGRRPIDEKAGWVRIYGSEAGAIEGAELDVGGIVAGFARLYEVGPAMSRPRMVGEWEITDGKGRRVA